MDEKADAIDADNESPLAFFRVNDQGERVPAEAPKGNPGGAEYFDGFEYNYTVEFSGLNAPMGSVYVNRKPKLTPEGWT